jgi:hypothetical protein
MKHAKRFKELPNSLLRAPFTYVVFPDAPVIMRK